MNHSLLNKYRRPVLWLLSSLWLALLPLLGWGQVSITNSTVPLTYNQDFNGLPASGSGTFTDNSTIPGVYAPRYITNNTITANMGNSTAGDLYSFGTGNATERALGSIGSSGTGGFAYGIQFVNNTTSPIRSITLTYTGEQWRNSGVGAAQVIDFSYQVSTSVITDLAPRSAALTGATTTAPTPAGYTAVPALNFTSPVVTATAGALDGNAAANRTTLTATITVNVPVNSYIMLRWGDPDHSGADDGLSIDDVTAIFTTSTLSVNPTALTGFSTAAGTPSTAQSYTLTGNTLIAGVVVTPPAGYEVSQVGAASGFAGDGIPINVTQADATGGKTIYVRLSGATAIANGTVTNASNGATTVSVTVNAVPLPVSLTRFTATRAAVGVQVAWATASEKNSDYFEVQRSLDGRTFASVAKVAAQGTTTQSHTYASLDGTAPAALLYYRLRQVDLDGTVAYSPVVSVAPTDGATAEFTLAPNPAHDRISFLTALPTAYTVRNTLGQLVRSGTTAAGTNNLLVEELPAGMYFFELHGGAGRVVRKFVKE